MYMYVINRHLNANQTLFNHCIGDIWHLFSWIWNSELRDVRPSLRPHIAQ